MRRRASDEMERREEGRDIGGGSGGADSSGADR